MSKVVTVQSLYNLCERLESIPIERGGDEEEERTNILRRTRALESLSCVEKAVYAKTIHDVMGSYSMVHVIMQHLLADQEMRLSEIENRKGRPFFLAMIKYHKNCMEEQLAVGRLVQLSNCPTKGCEAMSVEIRRLCGKFVREARKEEDTNTRRINEAQFEESGFDGFENEIFGEANKEQVEERKLSGQKKRSRKRKNKEKSKKEPALVYKTQAVVLQPNKEAFDEKVKVKAELRSKLSMLELEEEARKLKISTCIEEENATSSALESKIKVVLEKKGHLRAKVEDIESAIERLLEEKRSVEKEQEVVEEEVAELEKKKVASKEASSFAIKHQTEELEKVQKELKNARKELDLAEGRPQVSNALENFMARQIEELEEELVCPVCIEVTTKAPMYKCPDDHLICRECRPKLKACPQCREDYPQEWKRFRVAEKQGEKLEALLKEKLAISDKKCEQKSAEPIKY